MSRKRSAFGALSKNRMGHLNQKFRDHNIFPGNNTVLNIVNIKFHFLWKCIILTENLCLRGIICQIHENELFDSNILYKISCNCNYFRIEYFHLNIFYDEFFTEST